MKSNVLFLNTWTDIPDDVLEKHHKMQEDINLHKAHFEYKIRDYPPYQKAVTRMSAHHAWRNRMKLVENPLNDTKPK